MIPDDIMGAIARNGVKVTGELQLQINSLKCDSWELLFTLLSMTTVFCTVTKVRPTAENGNVEKIIVTDKNGGEIHSLTLTENGVRCKIRGENEEVFFEFGKMSDLVNTLRRS